MAFGKKFDKSKLKEKRKQQNPLFKRKKFCRFTVANVEQVCLLYTSPSPRD